MKIFRLIFQIVNRLAVMMIYALILSCIFSQGLLAKYKSHIEFNIAAFPNNEKNDYISTEQLLEKAGAEDVDAQLALSRRYYYGIGVEKNERQASFWALKVAETGNPIGEYLAGIIYYKGIGGKSKDFAKALKWLKKSAAQDNEYANYVLGIMYYNGEEVTRDVNMAEKCFLKAVTDENSYSDVKVALAYLYCDRENYSQAMEWAKKAADQGNVKGMYIVGMLYDSGWGVEKDFTKAFQFYLRGAELGNAFMQYKVGAAYWQGMGVEVDMQKAKDWFLKSAEQGDEEGQWALGLFYVANSRDFAAAAPWFDKAAKQNHEQAQCALGKLYLTGIGMVKNEVEGMAWLMLSAAQGNQDAAETIKTLRSELNNKQIKQAEQRSKELQQKIELPQVK